MSEWAIVALAAIGAGLLGWILWLASKGGYAEQVRYRDETPHNWYTFESKTTYEPTEKKPEGGKEKT